MVYTTLISPADLQANLENPNWVLFDCRFNLADVEAGREAYHLSHLPGARYLHLDEDMSGPIVPGQTGRHPLPSVAVLAERLSAWGVDETVQVVAYDDRGGALAARLWWMLNWLGHTAVAVLDGGWPRWQAEGRPVTTEVTLPPARQFRPQPQPQRVLTAAQVLDLPPGRLIDSRSPERYRGESEPIDPVAGHIPGARNFPFAGNLDEDGSFPSPVALADRFAALTADVPAEELVFYCGSGVTAAHNLLALAHAGLGLARLYPGSWSEWITDPGRPIATGDEG